MAGVLIVEDEQTDRVILENIVEGLGHEVYVASDGVQALNLHFGRRIDVVITDLHMPHVDGPGLIRALRASFSDAAIIAVSGSGPDVLAAVKRMGCVRCSASPLTATNSSKPSKRQIHMAGPNPPKEVSAER